MKIPKLPKINFKDISQKATSPTAYSAYAVVGVLATTVLAIVCTRKQCKIESEKNPQMDIPEKELTRSDVIQEVKETVKIYAPVIASACVTIFCIRKSNQKWMTYNQLINASFIATRDKMARYRALAPAAVGAEVIQGLNKRRSDEGVEWFCLRGLPDNRNVYFQSTKADVIEAEYHLNRNFALRGSASVREHFAFLGILDQFSEEYGDCYGWDVGIMMEEWGIEPWIDFEHSHVIDDDTGEVINIIDYTWEPGFNEDCSPLAWGYGPIGDDYSGRPMRLGPTDS